MFSLLKQNPGGHRFKDNREVETAATRWLVAQDTDCFQQMEQFVLEYEKCLQCGGKCVAKQWDSSTIKAELFLLYLKLQNPKYVL